jgi:hypothetical protein
VTTFRGSLKHVLDWTGRPSFLAELETLLAPVPVCFADAKFMPRGESAPTEARLENVGPDWIQNAKVWKELEDWWLLHKEGANTPNWDIAAVCEIEGKPGLVLVEAKANWRELSIAGKPLARDASRKSRENHDHIGGAIQEACEGWQRSDERVSIARDSHYQLANRLAFTWKLADLGIPVVLLYLGFTGDEGIRDAGLPFADDDDWQRAFAEHAEGVVPVELFDAQRKGESTPVWLVLRSRPVIEASPPSAPCHRAHTKEASDVAAFPWLNCRQGIRSRRAPTVQQERPWASVLRGAQHVGWRQQQPANIAPTHRQERVHTGVHVSLEKCRFCSQ